MRAEVPALDENQPERPRDYAIEVGMAICQRELPRQRRRNLSQAGGSLMYQPDFPNRVVPSRFTRWWTALHGLSVYWRRACARTYSCVSKHKRDAVRYDVIAASRAGRRYDARPFINDTGGRAY